MHNYYSEINSLVKRLEVNKRVRRLSDNTDTLKTYWEVGRLLVEAQGGSKRAKYGDGLVKEWALKLTKQYGKSYNLTNLKNFRRFYLLFPKGDTLCHQLSWSHIRRLLNFKNDNKRIYYINLCIERNLSVRELINEIKNNSFERLLHKPEKLELITKDNKNDYILIDQIKNPIIIKLDDDEKITSEKELQVAILAKITSFFKELGKGLALIGNEYKIKYGNNNYYIDILLFNVEINSYVVVELKFRKLQKEDKAQIEFYMKLVDENLKREFHNGTIGIIITKEQNEFIVSFVSSENIIPITYNLKNEIKL